MAKRHRNHHVRVAFHTLVKTAPNDDGESVPIDGGFSRQEFQRIVNRLSDPNALDVEDERVIARIKAGQDLPFGFHDEPEEGLHFGTYEGAYYGQRYRNNRLGDIDPESLNLRTFFYLVTRLRDGRILIGVTYHGQFGDYEGLRSCFTHLLHGNHSVSSKTIKSIEGEIGEGTPIELKLTYRRAESRPERTPLFGKSGVFAVRGSEFGDDFADRVADISRHMRGDDANKRRVLANVVREGALIEVSDDDIVGCTAIIRENGSQRTVYFLGEQNFSTKFYLNVEVGRDGEVNFDRVKIELITVMRERVIPLLRDGA